MTDLPLLECVARAAVPVTLWRLRPSWEPRAQIVCTLRETRPGCYRVVVRCDEAAHVQRFGPFPSVASVLAWAERECARLETLGYLRMDETQ